MESGDTSACIRQLTVPAVSNSHYCASGSCPFQSLSFHSDAFPRPQYIAINKKGLDVLCFLFRGTRFVVLFTDAPRRSVGTSTTALPGICGPSEMMENGQHILRSLLDDCWRLYGRFEHKGLLVRPSIPILFFGDGTRYFSSPLKVITIGLNPSKIEFRIGDRFAQFPRAAPRGFMPRRLDQSLHIEAMNAYFRTKPYRQWFNSYEILLKGEGSFE
jgi:hypothetical protein